MRRTHPNAAPDKIHESSSRVPSAAHNLGLHERMDAIWKNVERELPAIDDIETIPFHIPEDIQNGRNQHWRRSRNTPVIETAYPLINSKARERRRMKLDEELKYQTRYAFPNVDRGDAEECIYTGFYETNCLVPNENMATNRQMNCFTIINKHYAMNSDSSFEHEIYDEVEEIPHKDDEWCDRTGNGDIVTEHAIDPEKRTIWIYSFKNRSSLQSEADYELIDIPSVSASESSMELGDEAAIYESGDAKTTARVATPIPSSFVPRLDLSKGSTLPTVTEITEAKDNAKSTKGFILKKPNNSWFSYNGIPPSSMKSHSQREKNTTPEYKRAPLSARERRRMILHDEVASHTEKTDRTVQTSTEILSEHILRSKRTIASQTRAVEIIPLMHDGSEPHRTSTSATISKLRGSGDIDTQEILQGVEVSKSPMTSSLHKKSTDETLGVKNCERSTEEMHQDDAQDKTSNAVMQSEDHVAEDVDDVVTTITRGLSKKLHIKVSPKAKPIQITGPLENLDGCDWIMEKKCEFSNSYDNIHLQVDNAGTRLLIRNELLLKPSRWVNYRPLADSLPSLQITIGGSDSGDGDTWWRRVINCLLCRKTNLP